MTLPANDAPCTIEDDVCANVRRSHLAAATRCLLLRSLFTTRTTRRCHPQHIPWRPPHPCCPPYQSYVAPCTFHVDHVAGDGTTPSWAGFSQSTALVPPPTIKLAEVLRMPCEHRSHRMSTMLSLASFLQNVGLLLRSMLKLARVRQVSYERRPLGILLVASSA